MKIVGATFSEFLEDSVKELTSKMPWMNDREFRLVSSVEELRVFVDEAIEFGKCALDLETTGLNTRMKTVGGVSVSASKLVGFCLSFNPKIGIYVPVNHIEGAEYNLPEGEVFAEIKRLCNHCITIYHNSKYDRAILRNYGLDIRDYDRFEDTLILARLYDAGSKEIGLKVLSNKLLGQPMLEFDDVSKNKRFDLTSPKINYIYGGSDAVCTLDLYNFFMSQDIIKQQMAIYNLEKRVTSVVMDMEANLVKIDVEYLENLKVEIEQKIKSLEEEIYGLVGTKFNLGSPQQLGKILFDFLKYRYPEKERLASGQYSTDNATLEKIQDEYPVIKKIVQYRGLVKCISTYIVNLLNNKDEDGCIKLQFNQSGTDTGRFSSPGGKGLDIDGYCGMNIQSLPKNYSPDDPNLRKALVARPGYTMVAMDYSGEELRVAANLSQEPKWVSAFLNGADLHRQTGQSIFNRQEISKAERQVGKTVNFQSLYGAGSVGIAQQAKISEPEARRILVSFFASLPRLKRWMEVEKAKARKLKYVKTAMGRVRPLNIFYDSDNRVMQARGDRCSVNTLVQGTSADIMKTAMVRVSNWVRSNNLQDDIRVLITMHDELVFEIKTEKMLEYVPKLNEIMKLRDILQGILKWPVPLVIEAKYGDSWYAQKNFFEEHPELENIESLTFHKAADVVDESKNKETGDAQNQENVSQNRQDDLQISEITPENSAPEPLKEEVKPADEPTPVNIEDLSLNSAETNTSLDVEELVYTIKRTNMSSLRLLNTIIPFLVEDQKKPVYSGQKTILRIKDSKGNHLMVSDLKVSRDGFLALARFFGL